jgi:hypothetical protein
MIIINLCVLAVSAEAAHRKAKERKKNEERNGETKFSTHSFAHIACPNGDFYY